FVAGTQILMADGSTKSIEDLAVGDMVQTTDPLTGASSAQPVIAPIADTGTKRLFEVSLEGGGDPLTVTGNHSMWDQHDGWIQVEALSDGATLRSADASSTSVAGVEDLGEYAAFTVYNLSVAETHTYYVVTGGSSVLVHNCEHTNEEL